MGQDVSFFPFASANRKRRSSSSEPLNNDTSRIPRFSFIGKGRQKRRPLQTLRRPVKQIEAEENAHQATTITNKSIEEEIPTTSEGPDLGWSSGGDDFIASPPDLGWSTIESGEEEESNGKEIRRGRSASFYEDDEKVKHAMECSANENSSSFKSWKSVQLLLLRLKRNKDKRAGVNNQLKPNELLALDQGLRDAGAASQIHRLDSSDIEEFDEDSQQRTVEILLIGDTGVGKSCLMSRFSENKFSCNIPGTVGVDFAAREMDIAGECVHVNCWDTPGEERARTVTRSYYRGCHGVIIVYDVSVPRTFERVVYWIDNAKKNAGSNVNVCLVGNKADMVSVVETKEAMNVAQKYKMEFFLVSAKSGESVDEAFLAIIKKCLQSSQYRPSSLQRPSNDELVIPSSQVEDERLEEGGQLQKRRWKSQCATFHD